MHQIKRFKVLEVNDSDLPMEALRYPVGVREVQQHELWVEEWSADTQICAREAVVAVEREGSPQAQCFPLER